MSLEARAKNAPRAARSIWIDWIRGLTEVDASREFAIAFGDGFSKNHIRSVGLMATPTARARPTSTARRTRPFAGPLTR